MPDPNKHDQPAEGGEETVKRALKKQSERQSSQKKSGPSKQRPNKDEPKQR